jgi:energy-coupling factor transporter ATP-binding protein EcfA2
VSGSVTRKFPDHNPFSTSNVKPGAIAFLFGDNINETSLVVQLEQNQWRGEIVGPHGSGKSTLLQTLLPAIKQRDREVRCYTVRSQQPISSAEQATWIASTQVICEGFELLSRRQRKQLDKACRTKGAGLLVTCHKPCGFPSLFRTSITFDLASTIVEHLLPDECDFITSADVHDAFSRHGEDLRELLFEMYDLYELRSRNAL